MQEVMKQTTDIPQWKYVQLWIIHTKLVIKIKILINITRLDFVNSNLCFNDFTGKIIKWLRSYETPSWKLTKCRLQNPKISDREQQSIWQLYPHCKHNKKLVHHIISSKDLDLYLYLFCNRERCSPTEVPYLPQSPYIHGARDPHNTASTIADNKWVSEWVEFNAPPDTQ